MKNRNLKEILMSSFVFLSGLSFPVANNDIVQPLREYLIQHYEFEHNLSEELAVFASIRAVYSDKKIITIENEAFKLNNESAFEILADESIEYLKTRAVKKKVYRLIRDFFKEELPKTLLT
jgi:hypothetical protein